MGLAAWVNYVCPVPEAQDVLASSDDEETASLVKRWNAIAGL